MSESTCSNLSSGRSRRSNVATINQEFKTPTTSDAVTSETNKQERENLERIKQLESVRKDSNKLELDNHFEKKSEYRDKSEIDDFICKTRKKKNLEKLFGATAKPLNEPNKSIQATMTATLKNLFDKSDLLVHDTHSSALPFTPDSTPNEGPLSNNRPDITITHRSQPHAAYAVIFMEFKPDMAKYGAFAFGQVRRYAMDLLQEHVPFFTRTEIWAITTDGNRFSVYKFFLDDYGSIKHHVWNLVERDQVLEFLIKIALIYEFKPIKMPIPLIFGPTLDFNHPGYLKESQIIHRSTMSIVFIFRDYAVKTNGSSHYQESIATEYETYKMLASEKPPLPILTPVGYYQEAETRKNAIVFDEVGTPIKTIVGLNETVRVLQALHKVGIAHRDVRLANFIQVEKNGKSKILLIDFAFSCKLKTKTEYHGTWESASDSVLTQLNKDESQMVVMTRSDDLESLVKTFILFYFNPSHFHRAITNTLKEVGRTTHAAGKLLRAWTNIKEIPDVNRIFGKMLGHAKKEEYAKLMMEMKAVEKYVDPKFIFSTPEAMDTD